MSPSPIFLCQITPSAALVVSKLSQLRNGLVLMKQGVSEHSMELDGSVFEHANDVENDDNTLNPSGSGAAEWTPEVEPPIIESPITISGHLGQCKFQPLLVQ
ncbi:hypothetical protein PAXRUDRAFT_26354 [Paxillus rubicundulus Ve08.2h10]|uniref:Uncharacterized protein n=1 Tax=Paxillus rubicundulus Ve08.2h10 TaxID=930991 RepID=A0A0D0DNG3_9AGAM|nr:hypothetical protein PAXRUDRAFT_26354 [Paxillus rubicundulus Ve08.2h10]